MDFAFEFHRLHSGTQCTLVLGFFLINVFLNALNSRAKASAFTVFSSGLGNFSLCKSAVSVALLRISLLWNGNLNPCVTTVFSV